jgi:hypothetical protein
MTAAPNGHVRCQAPSQKCNKSATKLHLFPQIGGTAAVPGTRIGSTEPRAVERAEVAS